MSTFVVIRIHEDGRVEIEDEKGKPLKQSGDQQKPGMPAVVNLQQVKFIDGAFWYSHNPTCVVHGGRRYCR